METISIPVSYNQSITTTPAEVAGWTSMTLILIIALIIYIKSFEIDKK